MSYYNKNYLYELCFCNITIISSKLIDQVSGIDQYITIFLTRMDYSFYFIAIMYVTSIISCSSIVQLYEYGIPLMYEKLEETGDETSVQFTEVEGHIDTARAELVDVFREVLAVYKNKIFSGE